jgi:2-polyprenyl-6-methoxyphenol hydroxylase-like FAD-dependent oxidoreductase
MSTDYDLIVIGAGIAGSVLFHSVSESGARVLLFECETEFKDRVRGEVLAPWGVAEAQALGIDEPLLAPGAHGLRWLDQYTGAQQIDRRDFPATTLTQTPISVEDRVATGDSVGSPCGSLRFQSAGAGL